MFVFGTGKLSSYSLSSLSSPAVAIMTLFNLQKHFYMKLLFDYSFLLLSIYISSFSLFRILHI